MKEMPVPQADKVVGDTDLSEEEVISIFGKVPQDKEGQPITDTKKVLTKIFNEFGPDKNTHEGRELEKTERDLYIIHLAIEAVKRFSSEYGREDFIDLPLENIHILKEGGVAEFTKNRIANGSHSTVIGDVLIDRRGDLQTAITAFHELWHALGSYKAIQVNTKGGIGVYRAGFNAVSRDGEEEYFFRIDEALTGLMTKRFYEEVLNVDPSFKEDIEKIKTNGEEIDTTRSGEVKLLLQVAENIYRRNQNEFRSSQDVIDLFLKGQVTGNILPIARVIEKSFGKGSFREFGELMQN